MGRPPTPSTGGPGFRFTQEEVAEMESLLRHLNNGIPDGSLIQSLADRFTASAARAGKVGVRSKQVIARVSPFRWGIRSLMSLILTRRSGPGLLVRGRCGTGSRTGSTRSALGTRPRCYRRRPATTSRPSRAPQVTFQLLITWVLLALCTLCYYS